MSKGINTLVEEAKEELVSFINSKLELGLPVAVVGVILDNLSNQIKLHTINAIKMEEDRAEKEEESIDKNDIPEKEE